MLDIYTVLLAGGKKVEMADEIKTENGQLFGRISVGRDQAKAWVVG